MKRNIQSILLDWYKKNKRDLPWRRTKDPYAIWVSEIMLQQTQVDTVIPFYERWMRRFGTVQKLSAAPLNDVLKYWEGLGYYARARNLHKAAQELVDNYQGKLPITSQGLHELPGIGPYTASAIASIAFNEDTAVVDGNVKRVLSRLYLLKDEPSKIIKRAHEMIPKGSAGDFNQSLMELGATVCTPQNPSCKQCPISRFCKAYKDGVQENYPVPSKRVLQKNLHTFAGIVWKDNTVLIRQRPIHGLLGGLWEFPTVVISKTKKGCLIFQEHLHKTIGIQTLIHSKIGIYHQIYTHLKERLVVHDGRWMGGNISNKNKQTWKWIPGKKLKKFPFTGICGKVRSDLLDHSRGDTFETSKGAVLVTSE